MTLPLTSPALARLALSLAAMCAGLVPTALAAAPKAPAPAAVDNAPRGGLGPEALTDLQGLVAQGDCAQATAKLAPLRARDPQNPDLIALGANCALRAAHHFERTFAAGRYERLHVAFGARQLSPEEAQNLYVTQHTWDAKQRDAALADYMRAVALAPDRVDLLVGAVAAHVSADRPEAAIALVTANRAKFTPAAIADLALVARDALGQDLDATSAKYAAALREAFPSAAPVLLASSLVAFHEQDAVRGTEFLRQASVAEPGNVDRARQLAYLQLLARRWQDATATLIPIADSGIEPRAWLALARTRVSGAAALPLWRDIRTMLDRLNEAARQKTVTSMDKDPRDKTLSPIDARVGPIVDHYLKVLAASAPPTPVMRLRAARMFLKLGQPLPALVEADAAAEQDPALVDAEIVLADTFRDLGRFKDSLDSLDRASRLLAAAPPGTQAYSAGELAARRARMLFGLDRDAEAWTAFESARVAGEPVEYDQALLALALQRRDDAVRLLQEAVKRGGEIGATAQAKLDLVNAPAKR